MTSTKPDSLTSLEQRILKAVELVSQLRQENAALARQKSDAVAAAEQETAVARAAAAKAEAAAARLSEELGALRDEQKQVRQRVEKLLELIDSLGA